MDKLRMKTHDASEDNVAKIAALFPQCVTERLGKDGTAELAIDFDKLRDELSKDLLDGAEERYQFTWPDKRAASRLANAETDKTLRPDINASEDFWNTQNLYIEGDNLDVLKVLRENYLGAIKMIYIDPPYNRGSDLIYEDEYNIERSEYLNNSGQKDEDGNILVRNLETNGRFHTDWLNMIYPRLKVSRDLLTDDGIIFISINDAEYNSLHKICNEIFGERNYLATLIWDRNHSAQSGIFKVYHEYVLVFAKDADFIHTPKSLNSDSFEAGAMKKESGRHALQDFTFPAGTRFDAPDGTELSGTWGDVEKVSLISGRMIAKNRQLVEAVTLRAGFTQRDQMQQFFYGDKESLVDSRGQKVTDFYFTASGKIKVVKERGVEAPATTLKYGAQGPTSVELAHLFNLEEPPFDAPKPIKMIYDFIYRFSNDNDIILDFFAGSSTTAHSCFQVCADYGTQRRFILVQLPEDLDESLKTASKDAKKTLQVAISYLDSIGKPHLLTEIGKQRIRLAAKKVKEEAGLNGQDLDTGFRVLKLDSSNMEDVFYTPEDFDAKNIFTTVDNVKPDRTPLDLLFQVLPELNIELSAKIETQEVNGRKVFFVDGDYLIATFDTEVNESTVTEIAKMKPQYFVMRDASAANDNVLDNFEQIFKHYSPDTIRKII